MGDLVLRFRPRAFGEISKKTASAAAVVAGSVALSGVAGCGTSTNGESAPKASEQKPRAAVTVQQAEALVDHYEKVNNQANKTLDAELLSTVEGGGLFARSKASYQQVPTLSAEEQKQYHKPFFFTDRHFYIPSNATWFAVETRPEGDGVKQNTRTVLVFDREGVNGAWKNVASVWETDLRIPKVSLDGNGYATAVSPDRKTGTLAPDDLDDAVNDLIVTGGRGESKQTLESTPEARTAREVYTNRNEKLSAHVGFTAVRPEHGTVYALKTEQGVLAVFTGAYDRSEISITRYIVPSKATAVYTGARQRKHFTLHYLYQALAHIPATGKARLLDREPRLIGAEA